MDFRLILTVGSEPLPDERDRIQAEDVHSLVRQPADELDELVEHLGVGPVEVPLVLVEGGPHPRVRRVVPGEVAGGKIREDLRERLLELVGHLPVGVQEEVVPILQVPLPGLLRPFVFLGDVVENEVHLQGDPVLPQGGREGFQVVHRPQVGSDLAVVLDRVPAVVRPLRGA